ncbi:MAG TPA: ADOP family duplicated permease [Woeseiaceae bacterium]|nr:ADOP family duplicated permease [Woeseiaceae bacterium]
MLPSLIRNLCSAGRQYLREPLMVSIAIVSLAIAMGAGTYLFGFVNLMLLTPPSGLQQPERLVDVGRTMEGFGFDTLSYPNYRDLAGQTTALAELYAWTSMPASLFDDDTTTRARLTLVTGNYFDALGVVPQSGRLLQRADSETPGDGAVAVASHAAFMRYLRGDAGRIGGAIELNGVELTLVGVLPAGFKGIDISGSADFYVPLTMALPIGRLSSDYFGVRDATWLHAGGRLAPAADIAGLQAELATLSAGLEAAYPDSNRAMGFTAEPLRLLPAPARIPLLIFTGLLFGLVGLVLLVAAGNVAGLLIARGEARRHEIAMRHVLGARRWVIVRQLMTEVFALAAVAALLGLGLAWSLDEIVAGIRLPAPLAIDLQVPFDARVFGFVLALCVLVAVLAGLLPALRVSKRSLQGAIAASSAQIAGSGSRFRNVMVSTQVAFTLLLLVFAGLFTAALQRAGEVDLGYDIENLHVAALDLRSSRYDAEDRHRIVRDVVEDLRRQGQVVSAAAGDVVPLTFSRLGFGGFLFDSGEPLGADVNIVTPGFFEALGIPVRGQAFSARHVGGSERVTIVNEVLARKLEPGGDVIGKTYRYGDPADPWLLRVIGVTPDGRYSRLDDTNIPFMYLPSAQMDSRDTHVFVRSAAPAPEIARLIGAALRQADPQLAAPEVRSMEEIASLSLLPQRVAGGLAGALGALGTLLAALGLYGLLAAHVLSRTRELGVRLTLGASPRRLMRAVLWRGARLTLAGAVVGLALAIAFARLLDGFLFGLDAFDATAFLAATVLLLGIGLCALAIPARRVLRIEPQAALRHE